MLIPREDCRRYLREAVKSVSSIPATRTISFSPMLARETRSLSGETVKRAITAKEIRKMRFLIS